MSTSKIKIIDDNTFEYDGSRIAIEVLDMIVNPANIPSRWMRIIKKDPQGAVTVQEVATLNDLAEIIFLEGSGSDEPRMGLIPGTSRP